MGQKGINYAENHKKFILLCFIFVLILTLFSILGHAKTQKNTQKLLDEISLTQNATQKMYLFLMPSQNPDLQNQTLYRFDSNNSPPVGTQPVFFYLETLITDTEFNRLRNVTVEVFLVEPINEFWLEDGSQRLYIQNEPIMPYNVLKTTDNEGMLYDVVPYFGKYNITAYGVNNSVSLLLTSYIYFDYPAYYNNVVPVEALYWFIENGTVVYNNRSYLYVGDDLSPSLVDSGMRFLSGFFLFVGVLAVPIGVVVVGIWLFKKYWG